MPRLKDSRRHFVARRGGLALLVALLWPSVARADNTEGVLYLIFGLVLLGLLAVMLLLGLVAVVLAARARGHGKRSRGAIVIAWLTLLPALCLIGLALASTGGNSDVIGFQQFFAIGSGTIAFSTLLVVSLLSRRRVRGDGGGPGQAPP